MEYYENVNIVIGILFGGTNHAGWAEGSDPYSAFFANN
jgi:hypothetical protein